MIQAALSPLEAAQQRLDANPDAMRRRRETVENPAAQRLQ